MEVKILLRLIKEDVAHLERITSEFMPESLVFSDEVGLALARAKALMRELELLHKTVDQSESGSQNRISVPDLEDVALELTPTKQQPSELFDKEIEQDEPEKRFLPEEEPEMTDEIAITNSKEAHIPFDSGNHETAKGSEVSEAESPIEIPDVSEITGGETQGESQQMVNDILSSEKNESGYQIIPVNSIRDGIGINDRFLFTRELFGGNQSKFEITVDQLDQLNTIQDAVNYLKANFKWNKTEASQKFLALVKRRFTH